MSGLSQSLDEHQRPNALEWQPRLLALVVAPLCGLALVLTMVWRPTAANWYGVGLCAAFGLLVAALRAATPPAAVTGFLLTGCMYLGTLDPMHPGTPPGGWQHTALPPGLTLFVLAFLGTRFRRGSKEKLGVAESRRGRTSAQIVANMGAGALLALPLLGFGIGLAAPAQRVALLTAVAATLAEAAADTIASELGQVLGGTPRLVTTLRRVPAGTDGGVSALGTLCGAVAAAVVIAVAVPSLRLDAPHAALAWAAALAGLFFDSLLGATLERSGALHNDAVNFLSTAFTGLLALAIGLHL